MKRPTTFLAFLVLGLAPVTAARAASVNPAATLYVDNQGNGTIGTFDAATGATTNAAFVSGLDAPSGLLAVGNDLFVASLNSNAIAEYNATTGAAINPGFIHAPSNCFGLALSGGNLLVATGSGMVAEYNAATGAAVNTAFITGLTGPQGLLVTTSTIYVSSQGTNTVRAFSASTGLALSTFTSPTGLNNPFGLAILGNALFVADFRNNRVGEYDATTGAAINANFIVGLNAPSGLYLSGMTLLVNNYGASAPGTTAGAYNALTGTAINASYLTGLSGPFFITNAVPEPGTWALLGVGVAGLSVVTLRRRSGVNRLPPPERSGDLPERRSKSEEVGFEPTVSLTPRSISSRVP